MSVMDGLFTMPAVPKSEAVTVTELNTYIKSKLDADAYLGSISVKGEISNFTNHYKTGHFYFTIKDETSAIKAVMFKGMASKIKFVPENGMKIIAHGRITAYVRDGQYQINCDSMEPDGVGALYFAFEQLKKKLSAEGLFDESRKKPLPKIPTRIGVITSPTGAAVRDIINILGRRFPYAKMILYPALVQGESAVPSLIEGVRYFNAAKNADVLIIGRGGGSIEDLWAFNSELLAREIAASDIPVISAVGHETDFTICDFVADRRAPTPSAAAELAVPETTELMRKIDNIIGRMAMLLDKRVQSGKQLLRLYAEQGVFAHPERIFDERKMQLMLISQRLEHATETLNADYKLKLAQISAKLEALSPLAILSRGYAVASGADGHVLKTVHDVAAGEMVDVRLPDGRISARVENIYTDKE